MEFWKNVLRILDTSMEEPTSWGWYHILCWVLMIAVTVILCVTHKKGDDKRVRRTIVIVAIISAILEIYKQINFSFSYTGETITFDYQWYAFPFQFCSVPIYVGLLTAFIRKGKVHDALCAFLATYSIFAGCTVMFYPEQVFISTIGINIQTIFCHASMIVVGFYLFYSGYVKAEHKTLLKALPVFAVSIACAMLMNEIAYWTGLLESESFNMFYISPHCESTLPVYSMVHANLPYPLALIVYIGVFTLVAYLIILAAMGIQKLAKKIKK